MKTHLGCLLLLLLPLCLFAQPDTVWTYSLPNHTASCYAMITTPDGGYVLAGKTGTNESVGYCLFKINHRGEAVWNRLGATSSRSVCFALQPTADHGFMLAGRTAPDFPSEVSFWMLKTDSLGDSLWSRGFSFPGFVVNKCYAAGQTSDSGFVLAGMLSAFGSYYDEATHVGLLKTNGLGDSLWARYYAVPVMPAECRMMHVMNDGGFLVGFSYPNAGFGLLRTNTQGDSLWSRSYFRDASTIYSALPTRDGGYFFCGSYSARGAGWRWMKTDSAFNLIWTGFTAFGGEAHCAVEMPDSGFVLGGYDYSANGYMLRRVNRHGDVIWTQNYSGQAYGECWSILPGDSGGFVLGGFSGGHGSAAALTGDRFILREVHPDSIDFDTVMVQDTVARDVLVVNRSQAPFFVDRLVLTGYSVFSAECVSPQPTLPGDTAVIRVRCFPRYLRQLYGTLHIYLQGNSYPAQVPLTVWGERDAATDYPFGIPQCSALFPAYPNPFNPETRIEFDLARTAPATLQVFDISGRVVATLLDDIACAGHHSVPFNGSALPSGVYFCRLQSGDFSATQKMLLLK
jgi:hypothetical protein